MSRLSKLESFIELTLPKHYLISIAVFISGIIIATKALPLTANLLGVVIVSLLVAGFNSFNAVFDLKIDAINKRYRPLPSNKLSSKEALAFSVAIYFLALILAFFSYGLNFFMLVLLDVIITILYSVPFVRLKDRFLGANFVIGLHYGLIPLLLAWVLYHALSSFPLALAASVFVFAFAIAFCKDFSDYSGDKAHGANTLPVVLGIANAAKVTVVFLVFSYLLVLFLTFAGFFPANVWGWALMLFPLAFLIKSLVKDPVKKAIRIFKMGTIVYIAGVLLFSLLLI